MSLGEELIIPELARFYELVVKLIYFDNGRHSKPHVHVYYGDYEASVGVDGELLAGALPTKQFRLIQAWLVLHEDELYTAWNNAVAGKEFGKIAPLS
ncbi:MAG: DUF4160 domain-containing protein [Actinomycetaceae bacterium]|nr:DUF4160 domain-containing protein [Actinomycetaceae bacterium]MDY5274017.1 DUF4160 domain-containing protein [Arcanobacterium sp.]